jgi:hypothetical protein
MQNRSPPARRNNLQRTAGPYIRVNFRLGREQFEVRFTSMSRHRQQDRLGPKSANTGSDGLLSALRLLLTILGRLITHAGA